MIRFNLREKLKEKKVLIPAVFGIVLLCVGAYIASEKLALLPWVHSKTQPSPELANVTPTSSDKIEIDINGDGKKEYITPLEKDGKVYLQLRDSNDKFMAGMWNDNFLLPESDHQVVRLSTNSPKEYLRWDQPVGPHEVETLILTLFNGYLHPVYSLNSKNQTIYAPFYTSRGSLLIDDFDKDGMSEVVEFGDEYPVGAAQLNDPKIEAQIKDTFRRKNLDQSAIDNVLKIVKRENNGLGRGRRVIWAVHRFVDTATPAFTRLHDQELDQMDQKIMTALNTAPAGVQVDTAIPYSKLSKDSIDFNLFVRKFWTQNRTFEFPAN